MMALYVASHYKSQPNDLQLIRWDTPAWNARSIASGAGGGNTSKQAILDGLQRGLRAGGDLIPWLVAQQFQEGKFAMMSGARIVRIATHPDYSNMGYRARALQGLNAYYSDEYFNLDEPSKPEVSYADATAIDELLWSALSGFFHASTLSYITYRFWRRAGYAPLYIRQTQSELTGEFSKDFRGRFLILLSFKPRKISSVTGLSVLEAANAGVKYINPAKMPVLTSEELSFLFTPFDLKRLGSCSKLA
ncbi:GNAT acetyltransferase 2-domain-containing protein [Lactifluus subvellereus]|nr:GNAT acetyltransferase 2-domain-containing protein [Lactifluus subvellereus]